MKKELESGDYRLDCEVDICLLRDTKCLYRVGEGRLEHSAEGFRLTGCNGAISYTQKPIATYSLNVDFYWYEIGDVIGIGNPTMLYYCFPKDPSVSVAKARLATEELYKIVKR